MTIYNGGTAVMLAAKLSPERKKQIDDIAWMSTTKWTGRKVSTDLHMTLRRQLCGEHDIPLLVLHDFDKAGFSIAHTLSRSSDRYRFRHKIRAVDLGLRLTDVNKWKLDSETFYSKSSTRSIRANLIKNGATNEEAEFIANGKRVELNAFTSADLVAFIEAKLVAHGVKKIVPNVDTLQAAYQRAMKNEYIKQQFDELREEADQYVSAARKPTALKRKVAKLLADDPTIPWDMAVDRIACDALDAEGDA